MSRCLAVTLSSGAFLLGIRADLALVVAGALLLVDSVAPAALGRRARKAASVPAA